MPTVKATFEANIAPFRASLAQASTVVTAFDRTVSQVNRDLSRFGNQFSGATVTRQAETMAKAIEQVGGVTRLTDSELKRANATIQEAISKYNRLGTQAPADVQKLSRELQSATTQTRTFGDSLKSSLGAFASGLGIGAGIGVFQAIGSQLREIATDAARLSQLQRPFEALSGGAGQAEASLRAMREATLGLVSDMDLMQAANKASLLGLTDLGVDLQDLAGVATKLGRAMGQDATKSVDDLTTALGRMSPMILDNLGITVKVGEANEAYAAKLGKSADALTEQEKKLAFIEAAMEAARAKAATLGDVTLTTADQIQRMGVTLSDATARLLSLGNESGVVSTWLGLFNDGLDELVEGLSDTGGLLADAYSNLGDLGKAFEEANDKSGAFSGGLKLLLAPALTAITYAIKGLNAALFYYVALLDRINGQTAPDLNAPGMRPKRTSDITLVSPFSQSQFLRDEQARLIKEHEDDQAARLKKIEQSMDGTTEASKKLAAAEKKRREELERLEAAWKRMLKPAIGVNRDLGRFGVAGGDPGFFGGLGGSIQPRLGIDDQYIPSTNPISFILGNQYARMSSGLAQQVKATRDWAESLNNLSSAFARLGQIAGGSLNGVTRGFGVLVGSADTARETVKALSGIFDGLLNEQGEMTRGGRAVAGGLAGLTTGLQLGGLFQSRAAGFLAGAGGGAVSGAAAGGPTGALVGGVIGGFSGLFAAGQNQKAQRLQMEQMRQQVIATFGTVDDFHEAIERAGFGLDHFFSQFNSQNPATFTAVVNQLNAALAEQQRRAAALTRGLQELTRTHGLLSQQQIAQIRNLRPGDPGVEDVLAFEADQRQLAERGLVQAVTALKAAGDTAMTDLRVAAQAAASGIAAVFAEAIAQGESAIDVMQRLGGSIDALGELFGAAGVVPGEGFKNLQSLRDIATGAQTGPAVQLAQGLGQALVGLFNTGMLSPELFGELANGIGSAYKQLENFGKGGLDAARLMQPYLQAIWQAIQDNPALTDTLDDQTKALLDFAEQSGLVGDKFRPAVDRMIDALNALIDRLDAFIGRMAEAAGLSFPTPTIPAPSTPGTPGNGGGDEGGSGGDYPGMARGGVVTRPTLTWVGEGREPEAVIPLSRLRSMLGGAGGGTVVVPVSIDGREVTRVVARRLPTHAQLYTGAA